MGSATPTTPSSPAAVLDAETTQLLDHLFADVSAAAAHGGRTEIDLTDIVAAAHPFVVAMLHRCLPQRPWVIVTGGLKEQETFHADLQTWLRSWPPTPGQPLTTPVPLAAFFPPWDTLPHERKLPSADVIAERLETLVALAQIATTTGAAQATTTAPIIVTQMTALQQRTFAPEDFRQRLRVLKVRDTCNPLDLIEWLEEQGYEPEAQVSHKGELAWRGGIVDLWPLSSPWPVRLEFFGDELDSLREFDPHQQTSREPVTSVVIPPAGELGLLQKRPAPGELAEAVIPTVPLASLLDHLPSGAILVWCDRDDLRLKAMAYQQQVPVGDPFLVAWDELAGVSTARGVTNLGLSEASLEPVEELIDTLAEVPAPAPYPRAWLPPIHSLESYRPMATTLPEAAVAEAQRKAFFEQIHRWLRSGHRVQLFCNTEGERQRFGELWTEYGLGTPGRNLHVLPGLLSRGFLIEDARLVVVTDAEIYGRYKISRPRRLKSAHAQAVRSAFEVDFTEFEEGDFVVHLQHGIGIYRGLQRLAPPAPRGADTKRPPAGPECLVLEFAPRDTGQAPPRIFVPVTEAHLVGKYVGAGKARPQLNSLGGTRWAKAKEQAQVAVRDLAADLLSVQAARQLQTGYAFAPDTPWQREFEAAFEFEETPDQLREINATKRDMESARSMDRLLCGDVGFGKTEVAIRAAFKAVMGGRQVAVLVPTTVLAQQHYNSFRERMAEYPVRIEMLSRFRTPAQQRAALAAANAGTVDILIGTHRILSADVDFKNLGLVVVDEEQKFGVKHKEQFKLLRKTVDVLTLSATPIPRTLYLALTGARDLSTLETPPQDRLPVETIVTHYEDRLVRDAIRREMNRGGQVYFLHNRISTIEVTALRIRDLVPDARVLVGHGKMDDDDLEKMFTQFVNGEADVLVSTTIIESGLDIPNANTIIIDRADRFGLSELYQLRGRVGRYKHQAYCYLLLPRHAQLLTEARKRMSAIKQYSALGSGFKIAMRDLEIRGAGNLLGAQQSGHITAVGFDLYCQLLSQSVAALKGQPVRPRIEVRTHLDFLALNPGEERPAAARETKPSKNVGDIQVPREDFSYSDFDDPDDTSPRRRRTEEPVARDLGRAPAYLPLDYIREPSQRVEIYRKLAQITDTTAMERLRKEMRDRFGPVPTPVELVLGVADVRIAAAAKQITVVEVAEDKVKLTRRGEVITVAGRLPRLTQTEPMARLTELRKLVASIP